MTRTEKNTRTLAIAAQFATRLDGIATVSTCCRGAAYSDRITVEFVRYDLLAFAAFSAGLVFSGAKVVDWEKGTGYLYELPEADILVEVFPRA